MTKITCVKPSVTNMPLQLVDKASGGIHAHHSLYYVRTVKCLEENSND